MEDLLGRPGQGGVGYLGFTGGGFSWDSGFLYLGFKTFGFPLVWWMGF